MSQYIITREEYHNGYGEGTGVSFYVKELKPFLFFWKRWRYITHKYKAEFEERNKFKSVFDAREFIKNVLCTHKEINAVSVWVMERHDCRTINK